MTRPSDHERLTHISDATDRIIRYSESIEFDEFCLDYKTQLAIERLLEIIGEAANHVSDELKDSAPDVPWRQLTDLCNVLSHQYFQLRLDIIWEVVVSEIPPLKIKVQDILDTFDLDSTGC